MSESHRLVGIIGLFDEPEQLLAAAATVREAGYREWDCHTPYPVHGLDQAMGLRQSPLASRALMVGGLGAAGGLLMQWWMNAVDYPIRIGGKPLFSWPAFIPITFELFVLSTAVATTLLATLMCKLWRWHSPLHDSGVMHEVTSHRFAVVLSAQDQAFSEQRARELLQEAGCADVRELLELDEPGGES